VAAVSSQLPCIKIFVAVGSFLQEVHTSEETANRKKRIGFFIISVLKVYDV